MRKSFVFLMCMLLVSFVVMGSVSGAELKIGYVNVLEVFDKYGKAKEATEEFRKEIEAKRDDIEAMRKEITALREELETKGMVLSDDEKKKREELITEKVQALQAIAGESSRNLREKEASITKDLLLEIKEVIEEYAKDKKFSLVLEKREVIYGIDSLNITDEIVDLLNKKK